MKRGFFVNMTSQYPEHFRCGYVALLGEPNVGKSTLMNTLLKQKISIVTPKAQTTRHKILGILSGSDYQIIFLDTPGLIRPRYLLQEMMMEHASSAREDADAILYMIDGSTAADAQSVGQIAPEILRQLRESNKTIFLVINKLDLMARGNLESTVGAYSQLGLFTSVHPISAVTGEGTGELLQSVMRVLPEHPPFYPPDIVSEQSERFFVGEIIREKIFEHYRQEIPYSTTVDIVAFKEREGPEEGEQRPKWFISAEIYVERESQKAILIGKKGLALRDIGVRARKDIEEFLQHPVFLELHVKVRPDWRDEREWLSRLGYTR